MYLHSAELNVVAVTENVNTFLLVWTHVSRYGVNWLYCCKVFLTVVMYPSQLVVTKTRNHLKPPETTWNDLKPTGGHFAYARVNPLNDNSVVASNLMAGNRKLARKVTVLLKAISLVLWIPYFPTKNFLHDKNRTFPTRGFTCRFFSSGFSWPLKDFQDPTPKSHVPLSSLIFTGKAMHFYGLISKLVVLLIREEMHRSNGQLL